MGEGGYRCACSVGSNRTKLTSVKTREPAGQDADSVVLHIMRLLLPKRQD